MDSSKDLEEKNKKLEEKHIKSLESQEAKIRKTPLRKTPYVEVPASSQVVFESTVWYRSFAKLSLFALVFSMVCSVALSLALAYVISKPPETLSYLMDSEGRVVKLEPVRNPGMSDSELLSWASNMVFKIHNISFADYEEHIMSLHHYFTADSFRQYQRALVDSKTIEKVKAQRLVMWVEPKSAPRILSAKVVNGKFTWVVEFELTQYVGGGSYSSYGSDLVATMVVERASRTTNLAGVVISKYLVKEK